MKVLQVLNVNYIQYLKYFVLNYVIQTLGSREFVLYI